jgi:tmRNA-binding protein
MGKIRNSTEAGVPRHMILGTKEFKVRQIAYAKGKKAKDKLRKFFRMPV